MTAFVDAGTAGSRPINATDLNAAFAGKADVASLTDGSVALRGSTLKAGAVGWLEALIGATEQFAQGTALSTRAGPAFVFGTRTSDASAGSAGAQGAFAAGLFSVNDNTADVQTAYGAYVESRRYPGSGNTHGIEVGIVNAGSVVHANPFTLPTGSTMAYWASAGRTDVAGNANPTMIFGAIGSGGVKFNSGFIFFQDAVAPDPVFGRPILFDFTRSQSLVWRNGSDGKVQAYVASEAAGTTGGAGGHLLFTNAGFDLLNSSGAGVSTSDTTVQVTGTLQVVNGAVLHQGLGVQGQVQMTGLLQYADDAAAAAGGVVLVGGIYIVTATGNLAVRRT